MTDLLRFAEYRPDVVDYRGNSIRFAQNVLPQGDGYAPFKAFLASTQALPAACRGYFCARKTDGSLLIFAGTATKLYRLNNTDFSWIDVSKAAGTYTTVPTAAQWQFRQFGNLVIAVQQNTVPQVYNVATDTAFSDLGGSPPQASFVAVVGRFVVLSGIINLEYRVQWSGLGSAIQWTSGVNSSDFQDLPDLGRTKGLAGGDYGYVFQEAGIRRLIYAPGSSYVFQIQVVSREEGLLAPYSIVETSSSVYYLSTNGYQRITELGKPEHIGRERIDRTLTADIDGSNLQLCIGSIDPVQNIVYLSYKSIGGQTGLFDKILPYDYVLNRFSGPIIQSGEYLAPTSFPGLTLEGLDAISGNIDTIPIATFDDIASSSIAAISAIDSTHKLGFFSGNNLEATIETTEQALSANTRVRVQGCYPITDATTCFAAVGKRERRQDVLSYSSESQLNTLGFCPLNVSTRFALIRARIPSGTTWSNLVGVEPIFINEGQR